MPQPSIARTTKATNNARTGEVSGCAVDDGDDEAGQGEGEPQRGQALEHPGNRQGGDRQPSCRRRPEQQRVDRTHERQLTATGFGMWCVAIRLRKTQ
jgi:hypothetical protein